MIFHCARPTRAFGGRALREHRRSSASIPSSVPGARDQHECHSFLTLYEQEWHLAAPSSFFRERTLREQERLTGTLLSYA